MFRWASWQPAAAPQSTLPLTWTDACNTAEQWRWCVRTSFGLLLHCNIILLHPPYLQAWTADSASILFPVLDRGMRHVYALAPSPGATPIQLTDGKRQITGFSQGGEF